MEAILQERVLSNVGAWLADCSEHVLQIRNVLHGFSVRRTSPEDSQPAHMVIYSHPSKCRIPERACLCADGA